MFVVKTKDNSYDLVVSKEELRVMELALLNYKGDLDSKIAVEHIANNMIIEINQQKGE